MDDGRCFYPLRLTLKHQCLLVFLWDFFSVYCTRYLHTYKHTYIHLSISSSGLECRVEFRWGIDQISQYKRLKHIVSNPDFVSADRVMVCCYGNNVKWRIVLFGRLA